MQLRVSRHAKERFKQRFRLLFRPEQIERIEWFIPHLVSMSEEEISWRNYPFYINKRGMNGARVYSFDKTVVFIVKNGCVVTCTKYPFNILK